MYLRKLLSPNSPLLEKLHNEPYELATSNSVEKAYVSASRKHGMAAPIFQRRMKDVQKNLQQENKLVFVNESTIKSKTKRVQFTGLMKKYIKFINLAIASSASHLITYASQHFSTTPILSKKYNIEVLLPDDFM